MWWHGNTSWLMVVTQRNTIPTQGRWMQKIISALIAALLLSLGTGCATYHPFGAPKLPPAFLATCQRLDITPTKYIFTVNIARQRAMLFEDGNFVKSYRCSTSRFGIGEDMGSQHPPRGLHRIAEKYGDGDPAGTIFKSRGVIGNVSELGVNAGGITTRIMWLEGLEPGFNRGTNGTVDVDTHDRTIYIHGTGDQQSIGRPASHGCIHLADKDMIALYDLLPGGTLVWIAEK
jgi:hypothetical protein